MWEDPIVAEVHQTREKLAAEHKFDITSFFADMRKRQASLGVRLMHDKNQTHVMDGAKGEKVFEPS